MAVVLALCGVPGVVVLLVDQLPGTPLIGLALLVPGAVVIGGERLTRSTGGPDIHDRELDRIVAGLAAAAAVVLIAAGAATGNPALTSALVLAIPLFAIGLIALLHGTRRLWQQRAVPILLFAAWPMPWSAALRSVEASVAPATLTAPLAGLIGAILVALVVGPRRARTDRSRRRAVGVDRVVGPVHATPAAVDAPTVTLVRTRIRGAA